MSTGALSHLGSQLTVSLLGRSSSERCGLVPLLMLRAGPNIFLKYIYTGSEAAAFIIFFAIRGKGIWTSSIAAASEASGPSPTLALPVVQVPARTLYFLPADIPQAMCPSHPSPVTFHTPTPIRARSFLPADIKNCHTGIAHPNSNPKEVMVISATKDVYALVRGKARSAGELRMIKVGCHLVIGW
ncbi:hypothetical protein BDR07DRAFT_1377127 [Suillus spraguei]|nr:hypothetical protein BDR07DRAFT_1377127 [Suillus spraguei]